MFPRLFPTSVPTKQTFWSRFFNALDLDHSNTAHSDNAADTIGSQWTFSSTSTQSLSSSATWTLQSGATATYLGTVSFKGSTMTVGDGTNPFTWEFKSGAIVVFNASTTETHANVMEIKGAGALLKTEDGARIQLADTDQIQFSATRAIPVSIALAGSGFAPTPSGWTLPTSDGLGWQGHATATALIIPLLPYMVRNGSTLVLVTLYFRPATRTVGGGGPATPVKLEVLRRSVVAGFSLPAWTSIANQSWTGGYSTYGDGTVVTMTLALSLSIDVSLYQHAVRITDENGAGSVSGNIYQELNLLSNATDMTPA